MQKIKQEIKDTQDKHITERQKQEQIQEQLVKTMKLNQLLLENFVPFDEQMRVEKCAYFEEEKKVWQIRGSTIPLRPEDNIDGWVDYTFCS